MDITTSDIGGFVDKAKKTLADRVSIPAGYTVTWSGQFEYMERVAQGLPIVVPITLLLIFLLLYFTLRSSFRNGGENGRRMLADNRLGY